MEVFVNARAVALMGVEWVKAVLVGVMSLMASRGHDTCMFWCLFPCHRPIAILYMGGHTDVMDCEGYEVVSA